MIVETYVAYMVTPCWVVTKPFIVQLNVACAGRDGEKPSDNEHHMQMVLLPVFPEHRWFRVIVSMVVDII